MSGNAARMASGRRAGVQLFPAAPLRKAVDRLFVRRQPGDDGQRHRPFPLQLPDQNAIHTRTVWSEAADAHRRIPVAGHAACPPGAEKRIEVTAVNLCHADNHVEPGLRFSPLILLQCPCGNSQAFRSLFLGKSRQSPLSPKGALFLNVSFFLIFLHSKPSFYGGFYIIFQIFNTNKNSLLEKNCRTMSNFVDLPKENTGPAYSYGACAQTNPSSLAIRYSSTANCRRVSGWSNIRSPSAFPCMMPFSVSQSTAALASAW